MKGFISFARSQQSHRKRFTALLIPISFSAFSVNTISLHEEARQDGSYLSQMFPS